MLILIRKRHYSGCNLAAKWAEGMNKVAGTWVEVDTKFLFSNQFNTVDGVGTDQGLRVMASDVEAIKDDMRPYRKICRWCHNHSPHVAKKCWKCGKEDHFERLTPKKKKLKHSLGKITFTESEPVDAIKGIS